MLDRRTTLLALMGAGLSRAVRARAVDAPPAPAVPAGTPAERELQEDLARLGAHEYSDEGIPVFLACVDQVGEAAGRPPAPPSSLSPSVASSLRRYGDAWLRLHPDAPDTDVSKVIEVLAERDFARGGSGDRP